jgi:hypothetical protein
MKTTIPTPEHPLQSGRKAAGKGYPGTTGLTMLALTGALLCFAGPGVRASNILYNGNFNLPASGAVPTGWATTNWNTAGSSSWANHENQTAVTYDGSYYILAGNGWGPGSFEGFGRFSQTVSAAPGISYTLTVLSGADAWWLPKGTMSMVFLNNSGAVVGTATTNTVDPAVYGNTYDTPHPWASYSLSTNAPAGTTQLRVEFASNNGPGVGGSVWFENADLEPSVAYPAIANVYPDGAILMQVTNTLSFTCTSGAAITNIQVVLNGVDISGSLAVTGTSTSKAATYSGLKTNLAYAGTITIQDANGLSASVPLKFDTFSPAFSWEAEDFDFTNGLYINSPILSSIPATGSYFGVVGTQDIDENDTGHSGPELYRTNDFMSTGVTGDAPRQNYLTAQLTDPNIKDYNIGYFDSGEWVNYTRNFPAGKYNIYARVSSGSGNSTITLSQVTSGQSTSTQTTTPLGSFKYTGAGWENYQYVPLTDTYGNLVAVDLSGVTTLRATAGVGNMNFFLIVPAQLDLPVIANPYPNMLLQVTNKFTFNVTSPSATIPTNNIHLTLNGADVSSNLVVTGGSTSRAVAYPGLKTNTSYTAVISVTDANGSAASSTVRFDTYNALFQWEAEDWDYSGGQYVSSWSPCCYAGLNGTEGTDFHDVNNQGNHPYRSDAMSADGANDIPRIAFVGTNDYALGYFAVGEWVNHKRSYPAGTYNVYGRFAAGGGTATMTLSWVSNGVATVAGTFTIPNTGGWSTYDYAPLRDNLGNLVELAIPATSPLTLRLTHTGGADANVNFLMLTAPRNDLPRLSDIYPDGTLELQATNSFRFTVSNPTVPIYSSNISLTLNGVDVTPQLAISGSVNSWNVSIPLALNGPRYGAAITVQDANANVASVTIYFDTFNPTNYTWEAEDYDSNGNFIDNPVPTSGAGANSYFGLDATFFTDYYYESSDPATPYNLYNRNSLGIDYCGDYPPLARYVTARLTDPNVRDFNLAYWTSNSWADYTHTYPAGTYNVYARMASGPGGTVRLEQVTDDVPTPLGQFNLYNWGWGVYNWWPLMDTNGQLVTVTLGGVTTLRATTDGNANANRYMLVAPLASIAPPRITVTLSNGDVVLTFPTQNGRSYQVWGKDNLSDAGWSLLATLTGTGSDVSWSEPATQAHRFYRLAIP